MYKQIPFQTKTLILFSTLLLFFTNQSLFAQCGHYFKTNYRAVGKLKNGNNSNFLLSHWTSDGKWDYWNFQLNASTSTQNIIIYPSKPTGYWDWDNSIIYTTSIPASTMNGIYSYIVRDFNSDGRVDILIESYSTRTIYQNNGNGMLTALTPFFTPPNFLRSVGFYDLNGDAYLDWVTWTNVPQVGSSIGYQPGNADGSFGTRVSLAANSTLNSSNFSIGDFDGDSKNDIIYNYPSGSINTYVFLKNMGGGAFEAKSPKTYTSYGPGSVAQTADFNNDGKLDILRTYFGSGSQNPTARNLSILFGQNNSEFINVPLNVYSPSVSVGNAIMEINGDTNPDIFESGDDFYSVHINNGDGTFTRYDYDSPVFGSPISDISGDNRADLLGASPVNVFGEKLVVVKERVCEKYGETRTQDFRGDQMGDVVTWNGSSGKWSSFNGDWTRQFPNITSFNWGSASLGDIPAVGDFDGDGKTDYSVYRNSTGVWYVFKSSDSSWLTFQFGATGDIPVPGDYNGGGKTDFAVFRPDTGVWYVWYQETQQFYAVQFGLNGDKAVQSDYDGDGKTDIAVWRPDTAVWYYLKSSDNSFTAIQWGLSSDKPVPADFDGDGKSDLTVYRNGIWYVLRSNTNLFASVNWGMATDIPVPFYRNTYFADFVVLRPSNGGLYNFSFPNSILGIDAAQNILVATTLPKN